MHSYSLASYRIGPDAPLLIIAGPCLAESVEMCIEVGSTLRDTCRALGLNYVFKASFDKANRSSIKSHRGSGLQAGLQLLDQVKTKLGVPLTTDIHESAQAAEVARVADMLQIPAFLCRQTDLLLAAAHTGRAVNVKKGQFLSPDEMASVVQKLTEAGADKQGIMLTERGTFFGYQRLVNDFIGLTDLLKLNWPVCFDATHSTQLPGAGGAGERKVTAGRPDCAPMLAKCAVVAGVQAIFMEVHPDPAQAKSDAATMLNIPTALKLLAELAKLRTLATA